MAYRRLYHRLDRIVCQSEDMRQDLVCRYGLSHSRMVLIHNPVDIARIQAAARAPLPVNLFRQGYVNLVAAGRFSPEKGFDRLIQALALCRNKQINLILLGAGPLRPQLEILTAELGLNERVNFAGYQRNPYPWFARADYVVLSSNVEGFPNVALEALACGTPVIASPCPGGLKEIMTQPDFGWLADDMSPMALAEALHRATTNPRPVPSQADLRVRFGVEPILARYQELFDSTIAGLVPSAKD